MRKLLLLPALAGGLVAASVATAEPPLVAGQGAVQSMPVGFTAPPMAAEPGTPGAAAAGQAAEEVAPEKPKPTPPSLVARINLATQRMEVVAGGQPAHSWAISSGRAGYPTPRGVFRVQWTARMWYSRKYDLAPMPHAVFFNGGVAVHATSSVGLLGRPASHGCIRLAPAHAATFYALVQKHGARNTQVQVFGSAPTGEIARRQPREPERLVRRPGPAHAQPSRPAGQAAPSPVRAAVHSPGAGGMIYIGRGHAGYGRDSFVQNGIRYVRVR